MTKEVKLYDTFDREEFIALLSSDKDEAIKIFENLKISYQEFAKDAMGDFIQIEGYWFKANAYYQCLKTPTEEHKPRTIFSPKAPGDRGRGFYQRYRSKAGGKEDFNPTTGTGSPSGKKTL